MVSGSEREQVQDKLRGKFRTLNGRNLVGHLGRGKERQGLTERQRQSKTERKEGGNTSPTLLCLQ